MSVLYRAPSLSRETSETVSMLASFRKQNLAVELYVIGLIGPAMSCRICADVDHRFTTVPPWKQPVRPDSGSH